jgi:hypothetical protein
LGAQLASSRSSSISSREIGFGSKALWVRRVRIAVSTSMRERYLRLRGGGP